MTPPAQNGVAPVTDAPTGPGADDGKVMPLYRYNRRKA